MNAQKVNIKFHRLYFIPQFSPTPSLWREAGRKVFLEAATWGSDLLLGVQLCPPRRSSKAQSRATHQASGRAECHLGNWSSIFQPSSGGWS